MQAVNYRPPELLKEKIKPFDWTFSNDYKGTIAGPVTVTPTDERIDIERLKEKEKILFYQELMLYEDELHDNGISSCTIKIVNMLLTGVFDCNIFIAEGYAQLLFHSVKILS